MLLRQVAAHLEIDTALLSKVERGERRLSRLHVVKLAELLKVTEEELISLWLCDKIIEVIAEDNYAMRRAFENAGWKFEGVLRALFIEDGVPQNYYSYSITKFD